MIAKRIATRHGMSLIEVMIAMLVLAIGGLGTSFFFVYGRGQVRARNDYLLATLLASEKLEELKAMAYPDIATGQTSEVQQVQDQPFNRTIVVADLGSVKQVDVTVSWATRSQHPQVTLTTQIAP